jgi:hypothetical protein
MNSLSEGISEGIFAKTLLAMSKPKAPRRQARSNCPRKQWDFECLMPGKYTARTYNMDFPAGNLAGNLKITGLRDACPQRTAKQGRERFNVTTKFPLRLAPE